MPRLLHVPLVPLHVSRDVLALLLFPMMLIVRLLIRRLVPCRRERLSSLFSPPQKTLGPTPPYPAPPSHCVQLSPPSSIQLLRAVCLFSFLTESEHRHEEFRTKRITHYYNRYQISKLDNFPKCTYCITSLISEKKDTKMCF